MSKAFDEIRQRCEAVGLQVEEGVSIDLNEIRKAFNERRQLYEAAGSQIGWEEKTSYHENSPTTMVIEFPNGNDTYPIEIEDDTEAQWLLMRPFEKYRLVSNFLASWFPEHQVIECTLLDSDSESLWTKEDDGRIRNILRKLGLEVSDAEPLNAEHHVQIGTYDELTISIGPSSDMQSVLSYYDLTWTLFPNEDVEEDIPRVLALRIEGTSVTDDDSANELLKRVEYSVLSPTYVSLGLVLSLHRSERDGANMDRAEGKGIRLPLDNLLFWGKTVGVTGSGPYEEVAIKKIVNLEGGIVGDEDVWQTNQLIIVGREGFDEDYLLKSVEFSLEHGFTCRYLSQEDFWRFWLGQPETTYYAGDPRITAHAGLSFLASIGFEWPSIEFVLGHGGTENFSDRLNDAHPLFSRFGYSVRKGITAKTRRERLHRAITGPGALGLQTVAEHIAFLVRYRRYNERLRGAIERWESDLDWLYETYYASKPYSFVWPSA